MPDINHDLLDLFSYGWALSVAGFIRDILSKSGGVSGATIDCDGSTVSAVIGVTDVRLVGVGAAVASSGIGVGWLVGLEIVVASDVAVRCSSIVGVIHFSASWMFNISRAGSMKTPSKMISILINDKMYV